jgi:acetyl-CoA carboxylase biotin carboxyl carrier protein
LTPVPVGDVSAGPVAVQIVAPMVGTFYRAAEPDSPPLAEEGTEVAETTIVGIIESLQVLNPVQAGHTGRVTRVLATDGQPVEYGQPIFEVTPSG